MKQLYIRTWKLGKIMQAECVLCHAVTITAGDDIRSQTGIVKATVDSQAEDLVKEDMGGLS
jgi:hypothetical protein